ncbi:MAG: hypothetical protein M3R40_03835 [Pseudomonadota bacterium]|nr:hypothetical protein [Pseudomonadota bacterium]
MLLFAPTIFASAFLLFLVQPIIAKQILPWFGGSAAVWTTCLVFFQAALLAGYAYADVVVRRLSLRHQALLHGALLVASLLALPIVPGAFWKPVGNENPAALILGLLAVTLGLPYFLLSATSSLLQAWFARRHPGRNPYRLFALSNLASLLALLAYPFAIEPRIPTRIQAHAWSAGYVLFACFASRLRGAICGAPGSRRSVRQRSTWGKNLRRPSRGTCCGAYLRRQAASCCCRSPATSRKTSRPCRCCGSSR